MARALTLAAIVFALMANQRGQSQGAAPDSRQIEAFLAELQRASQAHDREAIAALIRYPVTIAIGGLRVPITDAASFLSRYDDIFNPPLRAAIEQASVRPQPDRRQITLVQQTFVIGTNEVVIAPVNSGLLITSISVPDFAGPEPAQAASSTVMSRGSADAVRRRDPRRIAIRVGPRATQIPGLLAPNATDSFILYLPKGQLAGVRLERVAAGAATIRVAQARTDEPLGARASADGRFVSGRPAEGADYRIDVRWTAGQDEAPLPYMLTLTLR